jgi:hypothetical protein
LLGPVDESHLHKDVTKPPAKDNMKKLEDDAVAKLTAMAAVAAMLPPASKKPSKEDGWFVGTVRVRKEFANAGTFDGIVVGHVKPVEGGGGGGAEKWIVQYTNGKQEAVDPQTLLGIMVSLAMSSCTSEHVLEPNFLY